MASQRRRAPARGRGRGPVVTAVWYLFAAMVALAIWRGLPHTPEGLYDWASEQAEVASKKLKPIADSTVDTLDRPGKSAPGRASTTDATPTGNGQPHGSSASWKNLTVTAPAAAAYDRDQWRHWDNVTSCQSVREAVLIRQATPGSLTMLDRSGRRTSDPQQACDVTGGQWVDPYDPTAPVYTNPSDLDIDHRVPLGEAAKSGGQPWTSEQKQDYANDLHTPSSHLVAVGLGLNRAKGDKDPAQWMPPGNACDYAQKWIAVKQRWNLAIDASEKNALQSALEGC